MTELYSVEQLWLETVCSKKREERVAGAATGGYSSHWKRIQKFYNGTSGFEGRFFYKMQHIVHNSNLTGIFPRAICFRIFTSCWSWDDWSQSVLVRVIKLISVKQLYWCSSLTLSNVWSLLKRAALERIEVRINFVMFLDAAVQEKWLRMKLVF